MNDLVIVPIIGGVTAGLCGLLCLAQLSARALRGGGKSYVVWLLLAVIVALALVYAWPHFRWV